MKYVKVSDSAYDNGVRTLWIDKESGEGYRVRIDTAQIYWTGNYEAAEAFLNNLASRLNKWSELHE